MHRIYIYQNIAYNPNQMYAKKISEIIFYPTKHASIRNVWNPFWCIKNLNKKSK